MLKPAARNPSTQPPPQSNDEFARYVEACRKTRSSEIIENLATEHATIVLSELLKFSAETKSNINIISGEFYSDVWGKLHPELDAALDAGCAVKAIVLCEEHEVSDHKFFEKIKSRGTVLPFGKPSEPIGHFYLSGSSYRVEVDDRLRKAFASFNDNLGLMTDRLQSRFERLWKKAVAREVPSSGRSVGSG